MSTNKIMELADTYACNRHADGYAHMEETPNTAKARAALQAEVECIHAELAASEAINKAAALEIVSLRAELAEAKQKQALENFNELKQEPVNAQLLEFVREWLARQGTDENYMVAKARAAIAAAQGAKA